MKFQSKKWVKYPSPPLPSPLFTDNDGLILVDGLVVYSFETTDDLIRRLTTTVEESAPSSDSFFQKGNICRYRYLP